MSLDYERITIPTPRSAKRPHFWLHFQFSKSTRECQHDVDVK